MSEQMQVVSTEEQQKKSLAWGKFGSQLYITELRLQAEAQLIIKKLITPETEDQIQQAEQFYAEVKKCHAAIQDQRKGVTSKFEPVIARLMEPEKSIEAALKNNYNAILKAKQDAKDAAKIKEAKQKELKEVEAKVATYVADMHAAYLSEQLETLSNGYKYALDNNIQPGEELETFKAKICARVNLRNRVINAPQITAAHNTQQDVNAEIDRCFKPWPAQDYVKGFKQDVDAKFSDWQQALKNKVAAKELNQQEVAITTEAIKEDQEKQKIGATLNALSAPLVETEGAKPLKEQWAIDEPATMADAFTIINAFAVNRNLVEPALRKITPVNLSVKQMIAALVAVKAADENFQCTGITFKKIDKL